MNELGQRMYWLTGDEAAVLRAERHANQEVEFVVHCHVGNHRWVEFDADSFEHGDNLARTWCDNNMSDRTYLVRVHSDQSGRLCNAVSGYFG